MVTLQYNHKRELDPLPNKPSQLIWLALEDLREVQQSKTYRVEMLAWHEPPTRIDLPCAVCFAGAVMAFTLDAPRHLIREPDFYPPITRRKLRSLDAFRRGEIREGLAMFYDFFVIGRQPGYSNIPNTWYVPVWDNDDDNNNDSFFQALENIACFLRGRGY